MGDEIPYDVANLFIRNKKGFHGALGRDGWRLPTYNSPIVTMEWL